MSMQKNTLVLFVALCTAASLKAQIESTSVGGTQSVTLKIEVEEPMALDPKLEVLPGGCVLEDMDDLPWLTRDADLDELDEQGLLSRIRENVSLIVDATTIGVQLAWNDIAANTFDKGSRELSLLEKAWVASKLVVLPVTVPVKWAYGKIISAWSSVKDQRYGSPHHDLLLQQRAQLVADLTLYYILKTKDVALSTAGTAKDVTLVGLVKAKNISVSVVKGAYEKANKLVNALVSSAKGVAGLSAEDRKDLEKIRF